MPSLSLTDWRTTRKAVLDEIEWARRRIGRPRPGRTYATHQINQAYAVLLAAHFQGYCRELHSECSGHFVQVIPRDSIKVACRNNLVRDRKLDRGNANAGAIGDDFNRFGLTFWSEVQILNPQNLAWQNRLEELNRMRNEIAHQDYKDAKLETVTLRFKVVRDYRRACDQLAAAFDEVMRQHLESVVGTVPW